MVIATRAEDFLGFSIPPIWLWNYPNIADLSQRIAEEDIDDFVVDELVDSLSEAELWFPNISLSSSASLRLFCFPYAGGGASVYRHWANYLPGDISVCPLQLPGRENRFSELSLSLLSSLIPKLVTILHPYLDKPFAFFGHSLGALISFELTRELRRQNLPLPKKLFISGSRAPQVLSNELPIHHLPEGRFIEQLRRYEGIPKQILQNPALMQQLLPAIRADFAMIATYIYTAQESLNLPMVAFAGREDARASLTDLESWREQTCSNFSLYELPGNHFFLNSHKQMLLQLISEELSSVKVK
jgi:surfactin synthase thioesterase subunit